MSLARFYKIRARLRRCSFQTGPLPLGSGFFFGNAKSCIASHHVEQSFVSLAPIFIKSERACCSSFSNRTRCGWAPVCLGTLQVCITIATTSEQALYRLLRLSKVRARLHRCLFQTGPAAAGLRFGFCCIAKSAFLIIFLRLKKPYARALFYLAESSLRRNRI